MTNKERLLTVLKGEIPDCVPVAPDFSNMIPARMTGKPFWQLYLYNDPPIWEAYIDAAKYFNIDSLMDGYFPFQYPAEGKQDREYIDCIIFKNDESTAPFSWRVAMKNKDKGYAYSLFLSNIYKQIRERSISDLRSQFPGGIPHVAGDNYFLLEDAIDWLGNTLNKLPQPFIGYFHFMPPHGPYNSGFSCFSYLF